MYSKLRFQSNNKIPNFESVYKDMNGVEGEARFRNKVFTTTRAREGCFVCESHTLPSTAHSAVLCMWDSNPNFLSVWSLRL